MSNPTHEGASRPYPNLAERTAWLVEAFSGVRGLAETLGVPASALKRWRDGEVYPSFDEARALLELDYVVGLAYRVWSPAVAARWMASANAFLDGATPQAVLRVRGPDEVARAIRAVETGAFA